MNATISKAYYVTLVDFYLSAWSASMHFYRHTIYQRGGSQAIFVELLYVSLPTLTSLSKLLVVKCERCHEVR